MSIALVGLACYLTWLASRRRNILLSMVAGLTWFGLAMWLFFSATPVFDIAEDYAKILMWVFFILTFVPFLFYMDQEIRHEKRGKSWTTFGEPPAENESGYEKYRRELRGRMRRQGKGRRLL